MSYYQPLTCAFLLLIAIGLVRLRRQKAIWLPAVGLLCLFLLSWEPFAWLLSRPLEARYAADPRPNAQPQAIVVLASYVDPPTVLRPYSLPDTDTFARCTFAAWLYEHWRRLPILVSAGAGAKRDQPMPVMRQLLQRAGVPDAMIWSEERSRNTHENAMYAADILRQHGIHTIALVVEAQSMLRAEECFRKQAITVIPAPCNVYRLQFTFEEFLPGWKAIRRNETTLHEAAGLAWYWFRDWI
jgi:uncharacterized SAM-binding protein YcdF (DUF218 family)